MDPLFLALLLFVAAGCIPFLLMRWFSLAKGGYISLLILGSLIGLYGLSPLAGPPADIRFACSWLHALTFSLSVDALSRAFLLPIFLLAPVLGLYGYHYLDNRTKAVRTVVSQLFFSLLLVAMALVTLADNMPTFALAWELMSLSSFFLVIYDWEKEEVQAAGIRYLLFTQGGALCIFAAFGVLYAAGGSLEFDQLGLVPHSIKILAFFIALAGFGSKAGVMPLHMWLPHAHPAAPSHVSALMSGVMIKMGVYGLLRLYLLLGDASPVIARSILCLGVCSGILGVAYALGKHDIKRLLAYHSIENIGIILIGCGLGMLGLASGDKLMAVFGFVGGLLHVLNHAVFKSLLFLGAGSVLHVTGTRTIDRLGGLLKKMPVTGKSFLIGSAAIAGLPPLNGFVSEFCIYYAGFLGLRLAGADMLLSVIALLSLAMIGGLASACFAKVMGMVFLGEPRRVLEGDIRDPGATMRLSMILLAVGCVCIGLWPEPFIHYMVGGLRDIVGLTDAPPEVFRVAHALALAARISLAGIILVALLRRLLYRGKPVEEATTWGCGFTQGTSRIQYTGVSFARSMVEFHRPFVRVETGYDGIDSIFPKSARYTSKVTDLAENGLQRFLLDPVLALVERMRWIQHGHIQLYIGYIVLTIAVLLLVIAY
ncbi:MAG: proton-conducting transporter membrane subunit [Desulfobulbus sp.]